MTGKDKRARKVRDLGPLHAMLMRGLPDWVDEDGLMRTYDLARYLGVSWQAAYKWFDRNRIAPKRIGALVRLSAECEKPFPINPDTGERFGPLKYEDFLEFL